MSRVGCVVVRWAGLGWVGMDWGGMRGVRWCWGGEGSLGRGGWCGGVGWEIGNCKLKIKNNKNRNV